MFDINDKFNLIFLITTVAISVCLLAAMITILCRKKFVRLKRDVLCYTLNVLLFVVMAAMALGLAAYNFSVFGFRISVEGVNMLLTRGGVTLLSVPQLGRVASLFGFRLGETIVEVMLLLSLINLIALPIKSYSKRKAVFEPAKIKGESVREQQDLNEQGHEPSHDVSDNCASEQVGNDNSVDSEQVGNDNSVDSDMSDALADTGEQLDIEQVYNEQVDNEDVDFEDLSNSSGNAYADRLDEQVTLIDDVEYVAIHEDEDNSDTSVDEHKSVVIDVSKLISQEQERLEDNSVKSNNAVNSNNSHNLNSAEKVVKSNNFSNSDDFDNDDELEALIDRTVAETEDNSNQAVKSDYYVEVAQNGAEDNEFIKRIKSVYARSKVYNPNNDSNDNNDSQQDDDSVIEQSATYIRKFPDVPVRTIAKTLNWTQSSSQSELKIKEEDKQAPQNSLPITRKHIILNRNNVVNVFADYLKTKNSEEKEQLNNSISTILLK